MACPFPEGKQPLEGERGVRMGNEGGGMVNKTS